MAYKLIAATNANTANRGQTERSRKPFGDAIHRLYALDTTKPPDSYVPTGRHKHTTATTAAANR